MLIEMIKQKLKEKKANPKTEYIWQKKYEVDNCYNSYKEKLLKLKGTKELENYKNLEKGSSDFLFVIGECCKVINDIKNPQDCWKHCDGFGNQDCCSHLCHTLIKYLNKAIQEGLI